MTKSEAQEKARALWGKAGEADRRRDPDRNRRFVVGRHVEHPGLGEHFQVLGSGASYEDAFLDAEAHKDEPLQKMPRLETLWTMAQGMALHDMDRLRREAEASWRVPAILTK